MELLQVLSFQDLLYRLLNDNAIVKRNKHKPMEPIKVLTKSVYGNELMYVVSEHAEPIRALTGKKTIDQRDINQLKKLGFSFVAAVPSFAA